MNPFLEAFCRQVTPLSDGAIEMLEPLVQKAHHSRGEVLTQIGQDAPHLFYIQRGLLRTFSHLNGREVTWRFAQEGEFYGCPRSILAGEPTDRGVQLLENSNLWYLDTREFERRCQHIPELARAGNRMLVFAFLRSQARGEGLQFLSAKGRYLSLLDTCPTLPNRVPLKYIASYLGITPVSLSRIRSEA